MRKAINCLKICAFILLTLLIGFNIQKVVSPKFTSSQGMQSGFKNEKSNSVDVLFLGTSNMFHTINPLVLYEDTGITSFDFGSSSQSLNMTYMYLKEALKTQNPKVVCLDVLACRSDFNSELYEPGLRWGFTYFPNGLNKYDGLYEQLGKVDSEYLSYIFPLFRYKDRWKELARDDFENSLVTYWKGCTVSYKVTEVKYGDAYWENIDWELAPRNIEMLDKIRMLCAEEGIELLFYKAPTPTLWKNVYSNRIREYADKYGIPFIDYNIKMQQIGIDTKRDFKDAGHVNVYGSVKITRDIGKYLKEKYILDDHRGGENNSWDIAEAEKNRREYNAQLLASDNINTFLTLLPDDSYTILCVFAGDMDDSLKSMLQQYQYIFEDDTEICIKKGKESLFTISNKEEYIWHDCFFKHDYAAEKTTVENEDGSVAAITQIYVDGINYDVIEHGISFVVIDNKLDKVIGSISFDADNDYVKISS